MQGNKGGPAIALSLTNAIQGYLPTAEFVFSVPAKDYELEKDWAKKYGYEVIENIDLRHLLPPFAFSSERFSQLRRWVNALRSANAMIQMSAISYVGPPSANPKLKTLLSGRFMDFYMSKLLNRSMYAWTQSYGPLTTRFIRFIAKCDLKCQRIIFCRGDDCLTEVKDLLPEKVVISYPDIAVTLDYNSQWAARYLNENNHPGSGFVSLSPSAVIYSQSQKENDLNEHIDTLKKICEHLVSKQLKILLVPHTFRHGKHDPKICDYGVSLELLDQIDDKENIYIVDDDLSATELKSIISLAHAHVGARYHSVVAALSSGVPTLSLSWHPKYKDIMRAYGVEDFLMTNYNNSSPLLIDKMLEDWEKISSQLLRAQEIVLKQSKENVASFVELIKDK